MQKNYLKIIFLFCLISFTSIAAYEVFNDLSMSGEILEWDEARQGINAFEMIKSGNYIVNTFQYETDYWNVKPPLSMWQVAAAYKIFGFNTFALRFFSALYLPVMVLVSMLFLYKRKGLVCAGVTGFLFAVSGSRFFHLFKTGDPDSLFFFLCFMTCLFLYAAYKEKPKYLTGAGIFTALAFLAKGFHVISLFAVIAVFLMLSIKSKRFTLKQTAAFLFAPMAIPVIAWAAVRASYDGLEFFKQMLILDVFNRVTTVVENHDGNVFFYFRTLYVVLGTAVVIGFILLVLVLIFNRLTQKTKAVSDTAFLAVFGTMAFAPLAVFTLSTTKITWYVFPCVIGIYFLAGYAAHQIAAGIKGKRKAGEIVSLAICLAFIAVGGFTRPFKGNVNYAATAVTSADGIFTKRQDLPGDSFVIVNAQGQKDVFMQSWLLHAYYVGLEYIPHGMEQFEEGLDDGTFVILKHADGSQLESFKALYSQLTAGTSTSDYSGMMYTILRSSTPIAKQ